MPATYVEAISMGLPLLGASTAALAGVPLFAIGSGGSLSAAQIACTLHTQIARAPAQAVTPLKLVSCLPAIRDAAVMFLTGGGSNPDVIAAFKTAAESEPAHLIVLCARVGSPLRRVAEKYKYVTFVEFNLESGRDGFLATNSLLATAVMLTRAYEQGFGRSSSLPSSLTNLLVAGRHTFQQYRHRLGVSLQPLWAHPNLTVLYGPGTEAAAVDLESRFSEAALGPVQLADFRNFGHGRHHWLAKHGGTTSILAIHTPDDSILSERTLNLVPANIPRVSLECRDASPASAAAALTMSILVAGHCGIARHMDPGRPKVPVFGRKLYHLKGISQRQERVLSLNLSTIRAIERKSREPIEVLHARGELTKWVVDYNRFVERIENLSMTSLALDYDGTLCSASERLTGPCSDIVEELSRLANARLPILVVTGRGGSVGKDLRKALPPSAWPAVTVGYYNGAQRAPLADEESPVRGTPTGDLDRLMLRIEASPALKSLGKWEPRGTQITLTPRSGLSCEVVWERVIDAVGPFIRSGITAVRSGHTIDLLAPGVSKRLAVADLPGGDATCLAIGDSGRWPGNDFELLQLPHSLSCLEASLDPATCWNLAPPGVRGIQATLYYLKAIRRRGKTASFHCSLGRERTS
jgi:hypothetical protein